MSLKPRTSQLAIAIEQIAGGLQQHGTKTLLDAREIDKAEATDIYLDAINCDVDIKFNMRELRDGIELGQSKEQFVDALLYAAMEGDIGEEIDEAIERLNREHQLDAWVDDAIDAMQSRRLSA